MSSVFRRTTYLAPVQTNAIDTYVAAFRARCALLRRPDRPEIDEPGMHGLLSGGDDPLARLLVTDDRACDLLAALLPEVCAGRIGVVTSATRCLRLLESNPAWTANTVTAMVCRDLAKIPVAALPKGLTLRPVRRLAGDEPDGVPLEDAVAAAMSADPRIKEPRAFAEHLRSLPPTFRLFAAVEPNEAVRGTSGSGVFGTYASVMFVNTDRDWRHRGIGKAMTGAALLAARDSGATQACLDATAEGRAIYARLGFEVAAEVKRFFHSHSPASATG
jgi:ribosomal protein S18 acetylase RimI-like enzyme